MSSKFTELARALTPQQVINLVTSLGADRYDDNNPNYIIFPTICHNAFAAEASMKLYYYHNSHLFHCYTDCGETFSIYDLFKKRYELFGKNFNIHEVYEIIRRQEGLVVDTAFFEASYTSQRQLYTIKKRDVQLPRFDSTVMDVFQTTPAAEWIAEGITPQTMRKFNIRYSLSQNAIVIPHYDIEGNLVGIRRRALSPDDIADGKYKPIKVEQTWYAHPLALNLYGLNITRGGINTTRKAIVFEGEKSVMLMDSYYGDKNNSVAICGSTVQRAQMDLLFRNCDVEEIIIALDKEYTNDNPAKKEKYFNKLNDICHKFNKYCRFSFIFDRENLLQEKDSPIDRGKEIFEALFQNRVKVRV